MSPRAVPMQPAERRASIVDALVPLLVEHGPQVSTRQIAQAVGIAEGTIFRVFPDKTALLSATVEHVLDPERERAELREAVAGAVDLRDTIEQAARHLHGRSQRVMAVMMAFRTVCAPGRGGAGPGKPPEFMVEANRALVGALTELFEPYAEQISVEPHVAAVVLRTLVIGSRHPGASEEHQLSPVQVADVMLHGVLAEGRR